jgi:hypothetical protein
MNRICFITRCFVSRSLLILYFHLHHGLLNGFFPLLFSTRFVWAFLHYSLRPTFPTRLFILHLITLIKYCEECKLFTFLLCCCSYIKQVGIYRRKIAFLFLFPVLFIRFLLLLMFSSLSLPHLSVLEHVLTEGQQCKYMPRYVILWSFLRGPLSSSEASKHQSVS